MSRRFHRRLRIEDVEYIEKKQKIHVRQPSEDLKSHPCFQLLSSY